MKELVPEQTHIDELRDIGEAVEYDSKVRQTLRYKLLRVMATDP